MVRSLVTGGSGFIGSHVVDALRHAGHEVVVFDREPVRHRVDLEFICGDVTDREAMLRAVAGVDYVHHLAELSDPAQAFDSPRDCIATNVLGTANVLDAARNANVRRVIFGSSTRVYEGTSELVVDEATPLHMPGPGNVYASSKITCELLVHDYASLYKIPMTVFRYAAAYGPRMQPGRLASSSTFEKLLASGPGFARSDEASVRAFVYVEDLARAHVLGLTAACENQIFNLTNARQLETMPPARVACRVPGAGEASTRSGELADKRISHAKALEIMSWSATTPFDEGVRRTLAWQHATHSAGVPVAQSQLGLT
jgi:UDP-glucose 4-epimerase